jgi:nitroimidazol reductase NimA-like FMN-containing flavoprotein (pyridoxamine 5'-phosphate oxidase superfamily)
MLGELNDVEIKNILSSQVVGRIACTDGVQPYIVPVTYTYDGQYIYGQTSAGKSLTYLERIPICVLK